MILYELTSDLKELREILESTEDEELKEEAKKYEDVLNELIKNKSENIIKYFIEEQAIIDATDRENKRRIELNKRRKKGLERFKEYVFNSMVNNDIKRLDTALGRISIRKNTQGKLEYDKDVIPDEYKQKVVSYEVNTQKLKDDIKAGKTINGATVIYKDSLIVPKFKDK